MPELPSTGAPSFLPHVVQSDQRPIAPPGSSDAQHASRIKTLRNMSLVLYISLRLLLGALTVVERIRVSVHERLCQFLGLSPCQVRGPKDSAVVVVGGNDGMCLLSDRRRSRCIV